MALRAEKMAERRERILATAREIIAESGFEALTTRDLADHVLGLRMIRGHERVLLGGELRCSSQKDAHHLDLALARDRVQNARARSLGPRRRFSYVCSTVTSASAP